MLQASMFLLASVKLSYNVSVFIFHAKARPKLQEYAQASDLFYAYMF